MTRVFGELGFGEMGFGEMGHNLGYASGRTKTRRYAVNIYYVSGRWCWINGSCIQSINA